MAEYVALTVESKEGSSMSSKEETPSGPGVEETSFVRCHEEETTKLSLHEAAECGNKEEVVKILQKLEGQSDDARAKVINGVDDNGWAALHYAAWNNHANVIEALLVNGADPEVRTNQNREVDDDTFSSIKSNSTALHLAASKGSIMAVKALLDLSKHPHHGSEDGSESSVPLKLVNAGDEENMTPLHCASVIGHVEIVTILLESGARETINQGDRDGWTPLHFANTSGNVEVVKLLLENGAKESISSADLSGQTPLHCASDFGHAEIVTVLLESGARDAINQADRRGDRNGWTPLHLATLKGLVEIVTIFLKSGAREAINQADADGRTPLHIATERVNVKLAKLLLENGAMESINCADKTGDTPLHIASGRGSVEVAKLLLENGAKESINCADKHGNTPLHWSSRLGSVEVIKLLLENGAMESINCARRDGKTPVHLACYRGNVEVVKLLIAEDSATDALEKRDTDGRTPLMVAILEGHEDVVMAILKKFNRATTHKLLMTCTKDNTTPLREAIKRMPDAAAMMLDCCTELDTFEASSSEQYSVTFDYSILEDYRDDHSSQSCVQKVQDRIGSCFLKYAKNVLPEDGGHISEWGPKGFDHQNLPLNLIAQSENLKLLKHPMVTYLVKRKWKVARIGYFVGLVFYCIFLSFLTAFALTAPSPLSKSCHAINGTANSSFVDGCELSDSRLQFVFTAAIFVVLFALARLITEVFQMYQHRIHYLADPVNWMELLMAVFAIIFAWVFNTDCLCPYHWQWQIGTMAVFLAWFDFIIFVQKLPTVGIYVAMLRDILWSFIKALPLAVMLVIAFSLGFFMLFSEPGILRSPFSTPARALVSIIAYTAEGFDYNGLFRLTFDETEEDSGVEEIPFPPVSYILFIVFVIIMSILLSNLLTALAVGDTAEILQNAEATNIAQKIQLILSVDAILPTKLRRNLIIEEEDIYPNDDLSWLEWLQKKLQLHAATPKGIEISEVLNREDISLKGLTQKVQDIKQTMETALKGDDEIKRSQEELKQEMKQSQDELKQELKQSQEELIRSQEELKQSHEDIKRMMREVLQKLT